MGVGCLVPQPVSARRTVPLQRGWLVDSEFHPYAGDYDSGPTHWRMAQEQQIQNGEAARPADCGYWIGISRSCLAMGWDLSDRKAHLDIFVHPLQWGARDSHASRVLCVD